MFTPNSLRTLVGSISISAVSLGLAFSGFTGAGMRAAQESVTTITVNSLSDDQTAGTGACLQSGTICLRNAITTANANITSPTTINFSVSGTIAISATLTITNTVITVIAS